MDESLPNRVAVTLRVYAELNGFLAPERRHADVRLMFRERDSLKDRQLVRQPEERKDGNVLV